MSKPKSSQSNAIGLTATSWFFIVTAACGWLIWIGNLFSLDQVSSGIIPHVEDLMGLILSSLFFLIVGLTPSFLRSLFINKDE